MQIGNHPNGLRQQELGSWTAHQTVITVLQWTHHGSFVAFFGFLLVACLRLLQFFFVESELDGVGSRFSSQVVHSCFKTLWRAADVPFMSTYIEFLDFQIQAQKWSSLPASSHRSACWSVCHSWVQQCGCWGTGSGQCRLLCLQPSLRWSFERSPTQSYTAPSGHLVLWECPTKRRTFREGQTQKRGKKSHLNWKCQLTWMDPFWEISWFFISSFQSPRSVRSLRRCGFTI